MSSLSIRQRLRRLCGGISSPYLLRYRKNRSPADSEFYRGMTPEFSVPLSTKSTASSSRSAIVGDFAATDPRCITHCRRGVAVNRTEVTLTIHQHVTQREWLRHTNDGVSYTAESPWDGIYRLRHQRHGQIFSFVPATSQYAHGVKYTRRCTGFRPSRTSGSARQQ